MGEAEVVWREEEGKVKNIRGFLFKRRKSPLKGWHKVYRAAVRHCVLMYCMSE